MSVPAGPKSSWMQQLRSTSVPALTALLSPLYLLSPVFILFTPKHRCRLPPESVWSANDSMSVTSAEHAAAVDEFIPLLGNSSRLDSCSFRINGSVTGCNSWVFDTELFHSTLVTELNLFCSGEKLATLLSTLNFVGLLVGVVGFGWLSDWFGRRKILLMTLWLLCVSTAASAFAVSPVFVAIVRFCAGAACLAVSNVGFVMAFELANGKLRDHLVAAFMYFWAGGATLAPVLAYFSRSWRGYSLACLVPTSLLLVLAHLPSLAPETPRWLLTRGRATSAAAVEHKIKGGKKSHQQLLMEMQEAGQKQMEQKNSMMESLAILVKSPALMMRLCIMCCNWSAVVTVYLGLSLSSKNLPGSLFVTSSLLGAMEFVPLVAVHVIGSRLGRRVTFIGLEAVVGVSLLTLAATSAWMPDSPWLIIGCSLTGKAAVAAASAVIYPWTNELYPTNLRSAGMSVSSTVARIVSLSAPLLADLGAFIQTDFAPSLAFLIFSVAAFSATFLSFALPETRGVELPDTVEDMLKSSSHDAEKAQKTQAETQPMI